MRKQFNTMVDDEIKTLVVDHAKQKGVTAGEIVEEALEFYFANGVSPAKEPRGSNCRGGTAVSSFSIPDDLSRKIAKRVTKLSDAAGEYISVSAYYRWLIRKDLKRAGL